MWNLASPRPETGTSSLGVQVHIRVGLLSGHPLSLASAHWGSGNTGCFQLTGGLGMWEVLVWLSTWPGYLEPPCKVYKETKDSRGSDDQLFIRCMPDTKVVVSALH